MTQVARRQTLIALEMVFSIFFLSLCYFAVDLPLRILECSMNHGPLQQATLPGITRAVQWILPEDAWAGLSDTFAIALGYASVASVSQEALSSRLMRWFLIPMSIAALAVLLPLAESQTCLCRRSYDYGWLDELVFLAVCLTLGYLGLRKQPPPEPGEVRKSDA